MRPSTHPGHHLLIPTYNTGPKLRATVEEALAAWPRVLVVVDGSTDGSDAALAESAAANPGLDILRLPKNGGKGAAVLAGAKHLRTLGATHVLCMDADGQHPADRIVPMMELSAANPDCTVMGSPVFGPEVPLERLKGRKLTIFWTELETCLCGLGDTLFGMRVYPVSGLIEAFGQTSFARGYDFDPEIAVRLCWLGYRPIQLAAPVRYFKKAEGGVSHFNYLRDNVKLTFLHFRLIPELLLGRLPAMLRHRSRWRRPGGTPATAATEARR